MTDIELNAILYYADFLSLQELGHPVTDNCVYYFIYELPINVSCMVGLKPVYDENNIYVKKAIEDYNLILNKFGSGGIVGFVNNICDLRTCGRVDGERMLYYIHRHSDKKKRKKIIQDYKDWMLNKTNSYTHVLYDKFGIAYTEQCTKYIAHYENDSAERKISQGVENDTKTTVVHTEKQTILE